ncbi:hypothetical protein REPUB_Repub18cG0004200 [Reevesia pubescens]
MVGKLLTNRPFNKEATLSTFRVVWRLAKELVIISLYDNLFLFKFGSKTDKSRFWMALPSHLTNIYWL